MKIPKTLAVLPAVFGLCPIVAHGEIFLNEVNVNPPGDDGTSSNEYIELISSTGGVESANGMTLLVVDSVNGGYGKIRKVWPLGGLSTGSGGLLLVGRGYPGSFPFGAPPVGTTMGDPGTAAGTDNEFGGLDNEGLSLLLVRGFTGQWDQDLDPDDNGTLNVRPWTTLVDSVGFDDQTAPELRQTYAATDLTQGAGFDPDNLSRKVVPQGQSYVTGDPSRWFGGDYPSGALPTDLVLDTERSFGGVNNAAATPGRPNESAELADLLINEVSANPPGNDDNIEYIEIIRASGNVGNGNGYHLLVVVTDDADPLGRGVIAEAWSLDNLLVGENGILLLGDDYDNRVPWGDYVDAATRTADPTAFGTGDIPNDALSLLLVTGFTGAVGNDLDTNNDGILDSTPWAELRDSVGFSKLNADQTVVVAPTYAQADLTQLGQQANAGYTPDNVSRKAGDVTPNSATAWYGGEYGGSSQRTISFRETNQFGFASFFGGFLGNATPGRLNLAERPQPGLLVLNEVNIDPPGDDAGDGASGEFIELLNPAEITQSCIGYHLLRVSGSGGNLGEIEEVWSISAFSTGTNGILILGDSYDDFTPFPTEIRVETNREDADGYDKGDLVNRDFMLLLVTGFTGAMGDDLDADNNGILDGGLGFTVVDGVNIGSGLRFGTAADLPDPGFLPDNVARHPRMVTPNTGAAWYGGEILASTGASSLGYNPDAYFGSILGGVTPGQFNHSAPPRTDLILINEINVNPPGDDLNFEYIELLSTAVVQSGQGDQSTNGLTLLLIDTTGANTGTIMEAWSLDSYSTGRNGLLMLGDGYEIEPKGGPFSAVIDPLTATADPERFGEKDLEENEGLGLMLVRNFIGIQGQDLDADDNGTFDSTPWSAIIDSVAFGERLYGMPSVTQATYAPGNISRGGSPTTMAPNAASVWYGGELTGSAGTSTLYAPAMAFDRTGLLGGVGAATPGKLNLGGILDDLVDNDSDGATNLVERALAMSIDVPDVERLPISAIVEISGSTYQTLSYSQLKGGTGTPGVDYTQDGLRYTVEVSNDLMTWNSGAGQVELVSTVDDGNGTTETVMIRTESALEATGDSLFMRLRITRLAP